MERIPFTGLAEDAGIWLGVLTIAVTLAAKPWRWRDTMKQRTQKRREEADARMYEVATRAAQEVSDKLLDTLMSPNGGKSLADLADKIEGVKDDITELKVQGAETRGELRAIQGDFRDKLLPRQAEIYQRATGVDPDN